MDDFDRASEIEAQLTEVALSNHFAKQNDSVKTSAEICIECDERIPKARQKAVQGCQYCSGCQTLKETRNARLV
jgi:phage/conjugal plasmid C-4 type zinc finger TraR family protein